MSNVQGPGDGSIPISHHDKILYEKEYRAGVDLFQRALDQYNTADSPYKKEAFKNVMDQAMQVLNQTASALKRADLENQNQKISQSFTALQDQKTDAAALAKNLNQAKKTV
ncbi:MAG: hypothetical protein HW387_1186 [Parachlamydiales bacterium]|nr:hypothetical protein [Parachlamydiales bacterium]